MAVSMIRPYNIKRYARAWLVLVILMMTGCADDKLPQESETDATVVADLAFTVSEEARPMTRMSAAVVQNTGQAYRGIEMCRIVPFAIASASKVSDSDMPKAFQVQVYGNKEKPVDARAYYYYDNCVLMSGVNAFLCYGRAPRASTDKHINGSLVETFPIDMAPSNIRFSLETVATGVHPTATALANYMTAIANAKGNDVAWKDAPNATLGVMYLNFINKTETGSGGGEPLPGSAKNISEYTKALKQTLNNLTLTDLDDKAIRTAIITEIDKYDNAWNIYPTSIGLPDGAAVIRWTGTAFEPQVNTTTLADINGIDRYAYPAELYYYSNSRIATSSTDKRKESYTNREWTEILNDYEYADGMVSSSTTAVAIKEPLQYGVARVQITLKQTDAKLKDAAGTDIPVESGKFPLTGVVIGGQLPVAFDFTPTTAYPVYSEADMKFIYDNNVPTLSLSASADADETINTLVMQTYDHKKVTVALELENNSGTDFKGLGGVVHDGTKFYLVGELDPERFKNDGRTEIRDRVFTQDYTTTLNMKVTSLEKAYNVVPNLLSPRLEMGLILEPKWVGTTPEEVLF